MAEPRFLRPSALIAVGDTLWVFDEFQPVAALLDRHTGELRHLVSWPEIPPAPLDDYFYPGRYSSGDDAGIWYLASTRGPLVKLTDAGVAFTVDVGDLRATPQAGAPVGESRHLMVAGPSGAWTFAQGSANDVAEAHDVPPVAGPLPDSRIRFVAADGETRTFTVQGAVTRARLFDEALWLRVDVEPWYRQNISFNTATGWSLRYTQASMRIPASTVRMQSLPDPFSLAEFGVADWSDRDAAAPRNGGRTFGRPWYDIESLSSRSRVDAGGLNWLWGKESSQANRPGLWGHQILLTGHRGRYPEVIKQFELGLGQVDAGISDGTYLWLAVRRRQSPPLSFPVELLRVDVASGEVHTMLGPKSVDITGHGWPLRARPVDAGTFATDALESFSDIERWLPGTRQAGVELIGHWPTTTLRLSLNHEQWPGIRLIHTIELFDELGRANTDRVHNAGWQLAESLESGMAPPPRDAVDGELWL